MINGAAPLRMHCISSGFHATPHSECPAGEAAFRAYRPV